MRSVIVIVGWCVVSGCAASHERIDCPGDPTWFDRVELTGVWELSEHVMRVSGDYAPEDPPAILVQLTSDENWLLAAPVDGGELVLANDVEHADFRPSAGGFCTGDLDTRSDPQPRWFERSHLRLGAREHTGASMRRLDPTLSDVAPIPAEIDFARDDDGLGFHWRSRSLVQPAGCTTAGCTSVLEVEHHVRRTGI